MDARLLCLKRPHATDTSSTEPWKIINRELGGLAVSDVHVTTVQRSASNDDPAQRTARDHIVDCVTRELGSDCGAFAKIDDWTDWLVSLSLVEDLDAD
jgi:hypothetical protein